MKCGGTIRTRYPLILLLVPVLKLTMRTRFKSATTGEVVSVLVLQGSCDLYYDDAMSSRSPYEYE
eukprot:scaffold364712_cov18-Prasinocladus_malaysianus.AAC.1